MAGGRHAESDFANAGTSRYGNPLVRHVAGKVAIQRGPLVYCLEQADNGESLHNLWLPADAPFTT